MKENMSEWCIGSVFWVICERPGYIGIPFKPARRHEPPSLVATLYSPLFDIPKDINTLIIIKCEVKRRKTWLEGVLAVFWG